MESLNSKSEGRQPVDWARFWETPLTAGLPELGKGRGIKFKEPQPELALFFRLRALKKEPDLPSSQGEEWERAKNYFKKVFPNGEGSPSIINSLIFLHQQQLPNLPLHQDMVTAWLSSLHPKGELLQQITGFHQMCQEVETTQEPNKFFYEALTTDFIELSKGSELSKNSLLELRKAIATQLLQKLKLSNSQITNDSDLSLIIKRNPETYYMVLALEKLFLTNLVTRLSQVNDAKRDQLSQELENKEGKQFNLSGIKPEAMRPMLDLKNPQTREIAQKRLPQLSPIDLVNLLGAYYLDSWSRHFKEDKEYAKCFTGEDSYLLGSCLPIEDNQLVIPEARVNGEEIQKELQEIKSTSRLTPSHIPGLILPFVASIRSYNLEFSVGGSQIGIFEGRILS